MAARLEREGVNVKLDCSKAKPIPTAPDTFQPRQDVADRKRRAREYMNSLGPSAKINQADMEEATRLRDMAP